MVVMPILFRFVRAIAAGGGFSFFRRSLVGCGLFSILLLSACGKKEQEAATAAVPPPPPSNTTKMLTEPPPPGATDASFLPHKIEKVTEFPQSLAAIAPGASKPEVRAPEQNPAALVHVEKGKSQSGAEVALPRTWDGTVLVPDRLKMARAFSTDVSLPRIEAHPLTDGNLQVWVRIKNDVQQSRLSQVACIFRDLKGSQDKTDFVSVDIPPSAFVDVYFISPVADVSAYTILVR